MQNKKLLLLVILSLINLINAEIELFDSEDLERNMITHISGSKKFSGIELASSKYGISFRGHTKGFKKAHLLAIKRNPSLHEFTLVFGGNIIIGDRHHPIVISESNNWISWPSGSNVNLLGLDSSGHIISTSGGGGSSTELGSQGNNWVNCPGEGDVKIQSTDGQNIDLNAGDGNIQCQSGLINVHSEEAFAFVLALDMNNNLQTSNLSVQYVFGNYYGNSNYISVDNSHASQGISIISNASQDVFIAADGGNINIRSSNIQPIYGYTPLLSVDSMSNIMTGNQNWVYLLGGNNTFLLDNSLSGQGISLNTAATNDAISFIAPVGGVSIVGGFTCNSANTYFYIPQSNSTDQILFQSNNDIYIGSNKNTTISNLNHIILSSYSGSIVLESQDMRTPTQGTPYLVLSLDLNNHLCTSDGPTAYALGNPNSVNNSFILVNNGDVNQVELNGPVYLTNSVDLPLPSFGYDYYVMINSNGLLTTTNPNTIFKSNNKILSQHAQEATALSVSKDIFNKLHPVQYCNKEKNIYEVGFLVEELLQDGDLAFLVTCDNNNNPMAINYNALTAVIVDQIQQEKKNNKKNVERLVAMIKNQEKIISEQQKVINTLERIFNK